MVIHVASPMKTLEHTITLEFLQQLRSSHVRQNRPDWKAFWSVGCRLFRWSQETKVMVELPLRLWSGAGSICARLKGWLDQVLRVQQASRHIQGDDAARQLAASRTISRVPRLAVHASALQSSQQEYVQAICGTRDQGMPSLGYLRTVLAGHGTDAKSRHESGSNQQRWELRAGELPLGGLRYARPEPASVFEMGYR